jgi:hypothetical protein
MSLSNATENQVLKMLLQGTDPSYRAGATQYLALFTADPGEAGAVASEASYTGYARVALAKSGAWTDGGSSFTNAALIQFGKRTDAGGTQTATAFVVVDTPSGAISQGIIGVLSASLAINQNIQPQFSIGDLTITAE